MDENTTANTAVPEENTQPQAENPAPAAGDGSSAQAQAAAGEQEPAAADTIPATAGKTYTDTQLAELREQWRQEDAQTQAAQKDFEKMTPEEQAQKLLNDQKAETERLKAELADRDLTDYARGKLTEAELPADAIQFVKGKDQADTDTRVKAFQELLAAGIQAGVEKRFQVNGYTPRGTSVTNTGDGGEKKPRGVSVNPAK